MEPDPQTAARREAARLGMRRLRERRRSKGHCTECDWPAKDGYKRCAQHLERRREQRRKN